MRVQEGDVSKFGRVRFRVKKIVVDPADIREEDPAKPMNKKDTANFDTDIMQAGVLGNDTAMIGES